MTTFTGTDRYQLERRLGSGGMGVVYHVYDRVRKQNIALKTLTFADPTAIYRLKKEFRTLADVAHPNLISLYELVREGDTWFFTMELVEGMPFLEYVRPPLRPATAGHGDTGGHVVLGKLSLPRLRSALGQLAGAVHYLHEVGTTHRDLKPLNVLVTTEGRVVVLDFGIAAQHQPADEASIATFAMGTAAYMAPEQIDAGASMPASDWYAVGVMLYQALTSSLPFEGPSHAVMGQKLTKDPMPPERVAPDAPADLAELCVELLARDPARRPNGAEILRRLGMPTPVEVAIPTAHRPAATMLGREQHLAVLERAFERSRGGTAVSVYLHGPSGIGKTTLVEHFLERIRPHHDAIVLSGRCYPRESMPYKAVDGVVDSLTRHLRPLPVEHVDRLLPRDILVLARVFPTLMQVGGVVDFAHPRLEIPDALELRRRAFAALRELLGRLARGNPLIVYIDDLQWADIDSIALLEDLLRAPAPPLLLVCCFRGEGDSVPPLLASLLKPAGTEACHDLSVGPLTTAEATALARMLLRSRDGDALVRSIVHESAGSPFVLEQLAQHVLASEASEMSKATLAEMLDVRIGRAPAGSRALLETLAVAQHPVDFEVAHRAAGIAGNPRALVSTLEVSHLIRASATADMIEVYHDRIRETLAEQLSQDRRRRVHLRLADAIRERGIDDPEALFEHYLEAGHTAQAAEQAARAASRAMGALAFDRAARFFRHAIELRSPDAGPVRELKRGLAEALANAGRPVEAADAFLAAREGTDPATALEFQRRAAEQLLFGGHSDRGVQVIRDLLRTVGLEMATSRRRALLSLLWRRLRLRLRGQRYVERAESDIPVTDLLRIDVSGGAAMGLTLVDTIVAFDFATRYLLMALDAGEPTRVSRAMSLESAFLATGGGKTRKRTERLVERAGTLARGLGTDREIALAGVAAGGQALLCGEYRRAAGVLLEAEHMLRERCTGVMWELTTCYTFLLSCLVYLGELQEVRRRLPGMVAHALERGNLLAATEARTRANFGWLALGEVNVAQRELDEALATWSHSGFHRQHYNALISQCNIHLYRGDAASAWERLERDWEPLARSLLLRIQVLRAESNYLRARCALAEAARGRDPDRLLRLVQRHAARLARERMPWIDPFATSIRAGAAWLADDRETARRLLAAAAEQFDGSHMAIHAAAARRRLGQVTGGDEGRHLVRRSDEVMGNQGVPEPDRVADVLVPGFVF